MVVAENRKSSFLVKGSLGMNIMSSIVAAIGIILFLVDIVYFPSFISDSYYAWARRTAQGLSAVLLIFSILELFIGLVASSFGCKAVYYEADEATHFVPDAIVSHQGVLIPVDPPPYEA
ncbi:membrane-spanning 4-domains subfamily A member 8-like [Hemicordylus capensis]|uniref:membrane-spanning 4-domains subfamily A member 8-like n=1 Tax=Hemicordylus capensis TaxID=884348 RepID=UPI0023040099|nr:membrane-spanning 4-domains subfamily A member 8-like [Hemicordylus capensis]